MKYLIVLAAFCAICAEAQEIVTCEGATMEITCQEGKVLQIQEAYYGRRDTTTCAKANLMRDTNCRRDAVGELSGRCQGQGACALRVENAVFGDPCYGTYKYLRVNYACVASEEAHENVTCEGATMGITCQEGKVLKIKEAYYGRRDDTTCPKPNKMNDTNCRHDAVSTLNNRCQGQGACALRVENAVFGDPCYGTYKYLRVNYACVASGEAQEIMACEGATMVITCQEGEVLKIKEAYYGRRDDTSCPKPNKMNDTNCRRDAVGALSYRCEGQGACALRVENAVFGDPCYGTYKYLRVNYACVASGEHDPCKPNPCKKGARCISFGGGIWCKCPDPYIGPLCQEKNDLCKPNPCYNDGLCFSVGFGISCVCPEGYTGDRCQNGKGGGGGYNCDDRNPCTRENVEAQKFYHPHTDPSKFVQCDQWGQCFVMACGAGGTVWNEEASTCTLP